MRKRRRRKQAEPPIQMNNPGFTDPACDHFDLFKSPGIQRDKRHNASTSITR